MVDLIVEEVRKLRDGHAARFNYDLDAIYDDLKRAEKDRALTLTSLPPKRIAKVSEPVRA